MNQLRKQFQSLILLCFMTLVAGCTAPLKEAILLDPGFQTSMASEISLLPAIDARLDTETDVDVQEQINGSAKKALEKRGYQVSISDYVESATQYTEAELKAGNPQWIQKLPARKRWIMVLVLNDVSTKLTFGSTGNAEVSGYLYDKTNGIIVWRDKGVGKVGQGGLIGMALKGLMDEEAIHMAIRNLVASIPERDI